MNHKRLGVILIIATMLGTGLPIIFADDCPQYINPHCVMTPKFQVLIEDKISVIPGYEGPPVPVLLPQPTYGYGKNVTVQVWILGVADIYAYDFGLTWDDTDHLVLTSYKVEDVWTNKFQVLPDVNYDQNCLGKASTNFYEQAVTALPPSVGVSGNFKLATLIFTIYNDICPCAGPLDITFAMTTMKVSDSCSQPILLCNPDNGVAELIPIWPDIMLVPNNETNYVVGEKFTKEIWVSNVTRMKSLHFQLNWNKWYVPPPLPRWNDALKLEYVDFDLNNLKDLQTATWNDVNASDHHELTVDIQIKCTSPSLNGTFRVATLTFLKLDPWYCGSQPDYTFRQPHEWTAENATVKFQFWKGWFDGLCPTIYFGAAFNPPLGKTFTRGYGIAEWVDCACADTGGGAVNLTISVSTDVAGVKFTIGEVGNPYDLTTKYLTIGDLASVGERVKGTGGVGIGIIALNLDNGLPHVWISSTVSVASSDYYWFIPSSWDLYYWDGEDWSTLTATTYTGYALTDIPAIATYRVLGFVSFIGWPKGTCHNCVDGFGITVKDPRGNYELCFDLEPCQTSKWYDAGLYELCYGKISDLFTFMPIPGDLNRDGVVDITDILKVSQYYGNAKEGWEYYDFNDDGYVDIFDVVVVSKNFGRTTP